MNSTVRHGNGNLVTEICRAARVALALAVALGLGAVTTRPAQAQTYTESVLHTFTGGTDGGNPEAGLIMDANGHLYGTTAAGGSPVPAQGVVFKMTGKDRTNETVLYTFCPNEGGHCDPTPGVTPLAGLITDAKGNLYGTTSDGGDTGQGVVFELSPPAKKSDKWMETVLYSFCPKGRGTCIDGEHPLAGLIMDPGGNLYGTTNQGGDLKCSQENYGCGVVFKLDPTTRTETVLYRFTTGDGGPNGSLIMDAKGNLYGTTGAGGDTWLRGTVFKLAPKGKKWAETVLHTFTGVNGDGMFPQAGLIMDAQGDLYGTTANGGNWNCFGGASCGTVFKVSTKGSKSKETILYTFCQSGTCTDGAQPSAGLIMDARGNLYSTTLYGGDLNCDSYFPGCGTVFKLTPKGKKWSETVLYSFTGGADGVNPYAGLITDAKGDLYGTTYQGGSYNAGTVFELTP